MALDREPRWLDELERFGVKSLVKLALGVFALLFFGFLASLLPGLALFSELLAIPVIPIVHAAVTLLLVLLLYKIATQARSIITQLRTEATDARNGVASIVYWGVLLLAVVIGFEGFRGLGEYLFAHAGFEVFYPLVFVLMALIPLTFLVVEIGVFVQRRRQHALHTEVERRDIRTNEEQVLALLEARDGVTYQVEVAEVSGWSKAKVSRVLSEMEAAGAITRRQIGREKIVYLPGHEPGVLTSAADEATED